MLTAEEIRAKVYQQAALFDKLVRDRDWYRAKSAYDTAVAVSVFCLFDEQDKKALFGERGERGVILQDGLFREDKVQKAYWECIRLNRTREQERYRPMPSAEGRLDA